MNTDLKPIAYFYNLVLWAIFSGGKEKLSIGFLQRIAGARMWWFLLPLFIFFVIRVAYVYFKKEKMKKHLTFNRLFAITTTGFAGLALEIVIIFSFQNIYGYIYQKIGLIVSLFMVGLTLGGYGMNMLIQRGYRRWTEILMANELMIFANAFVLPYIFKAFAETGSLGSPFLGSEYVFMILAASIGFLTGVEFPTGEQDNFGIKNGDGQGCWDYRRFRSFRSLPWRPLYGFVPRPLVRNRRFLYP